MSRRKKLKREAAQLRGRIEHRAGLVDLRIDVLMHRVRALARKPAALPVAFLCGILAERLFPVIRRASRLLGDQVKTMQIASSLVGLRIP